MSNEEKLLKLLSETQDIDAFAEFFISALAKLCTAGTAQESSLDSQEKVS